MGRQLISATLVVGALALLVRFGQQLPAHGSWPSMAELVPVMVIFAAVAGVLANLKEISGWFSSPGQAKRRGEETTIEPLDPNLAQRNRQTMLAKMRAIWIHGLLERSLSAERRIELGLEDAPGAVKLPINLELLAERPTRRALPPGTPILAVFDQLGATLLILGGPGSGKTTLLLELARALIDRAQQEGSEPIPIVLNLSSWALKQQPLSAWVIEEMNNQYLVPPDVASRWLATDQLLLMLDGLDEVRAERRETCVRAINSWREEHGLARLAVCSRSGDYQVLTSQLKLAGAVEIQPLTPDQAEAYLERWGEALAPLRTQLRKDPTLSELTQTPLMLSILATTLEADGVGEDQPLGTVAEWRERLFGSYVRRMLARRTGASGHNDRDIMRSLSWLAHTMRRHDCSVFALEGLQQSWLPDKRWIRPYQLLATASAATVGMIIVAIPLATVPWMLWKLLPFVLAAGLILGGVVLDEFKKPIRTISRIQWSWPEFRKGLMKSLRQPFVYLVALAWSAFVVSTQYATTRMQPMGLLTTILMWCLFEGFQQARTVTTTIPLQSWPNRGMHTSAVVIVLMASRMALLGAGLGALAGVYSHFVDLTTPYVKLLIPYVHSHLAAMALGYAVVGFSLGLVLSLAVSGSDIIFRHIALRLVLAACGAIPLNVVKFLDDCDQRLLLRKVGGSYTFVHRLLLDHFADQSTPSRHPIPPSP